jgi:hypothetical protein
MSTPDAISVLQDQLALALQTIANLQAAAAATAIAAPGKVEPKIYYSSVPFCNLQIMRGPGYCESVAVVAGRIETDDAQVLEALKAIADKPGSGIYSRTAPEVTAEQAAMETDVFNAAAIAQGKMIAAGLPTA